MSDGHVIHEPSFAEREIHFHLHRAVMLHEAGVIRDEHFYWRCVDHLLDDLIAVQRGEPVQPRIEIIADRLPGFEEEPF